MLPSVTPWVVAGLASLCAILLFMRLRAVQANLRESEDEVESFEEKLRGAAKRSEARSAGERRREDELPELRRKLEKARKRATQAREEQRKESYRIKELEDRLRLRGSDAPTTAAGRTLKTELAAVSSVNSAPTPVAAAPKPPEPKAPEPPEPKAPEPVSPPAPSPEVIESEALAAAVKRAEQAEASRDQIRLKLAELEFQAKRRQAKVRTQEMLYASIRLELEAKKDRLGTQQEELERLRALRVVLMDSPAPTTTPLAEQEAVLESAPAAPAAAADEEPRGEAGASSG